MNWGKKQEDLMLTTLIEDLMLTALKKTMLSCLFLLGKKTVTEIQMKKNLCGRNKLQICHFIFFLLFKNTVCTKNH